VNGSRLGHDDARAIDVFVTDREDRPVTDLTVDDFEIRERDLVQTIAGFERISIPLGNRPVDLNAAPAPPKDVFSNAPPPPGGRAFVFVLAGLELRYIVQIKRLMTEFLRLLGPDDAVAIVYPRRSDLSQDFTKDQGPRHRRQQRERRPRSLAPHQVGRLRNVIGAVAAARRAGGP
jgi:hypothetical protein